MFSKTLLGLAAVVAVVTASAETRAQNQPYRGQVVVNRTTVNNVYNGGGYGWNGGAARTWNYNCTGCYPGSGPYDSAIATTGIAAGAAVLTGVIGMIASQRQQPQTVIVNNPQPVVVAPPAGVAEPAYQSGPFCQTFITGYSPNGVPVYVRSCR